MENQLVRAREGQITRAVGQVAQDEGVDKQILCELVASGKVVILENNQHKNFTPKGVGKNLSIKVNANLGTSPECVDIKVELEKLTMAMEAGADTVMDLSTGGDLDEIRKTIIEQSKIPIGTVPIYQAAVETIKKKKTITKMDPEELFDVIEKQGQSGVDFITVHYGSYASIAGETQDPGTRHGHSEQGRGFPRRVDDRQQARESPLRAVRQAGGHRKEI